MKLLIPLAALGGALVLLLTDLSAHTLDYL
jgi:ABC-type Fe3+-siderophore transport system permease subunit